MGGIVGNGLFNGWSDGALTGQEIIQTIQDAMITGAISYGVDFVAEEITDHPLLQAFTARVLTGAIEGAFLPQGLFSGMFQAATSSILGGINTLLSDPVTFASLIDRTDFVTALESQLTYAFNESTRQAVYNAGGLASALMSPKMDIVLPNGATAKEAILSSGEGVIYDEFGNFAGLERAGIIQLGEFGYSTVDGQFGLIEGDIYEYSLDGYGYYHVQVDNNRVTLSEYIPLDNNPMSDVEIRIDVSPDGIQYDDDGYLSDGEITIGDNTVTLDDGELVHGDFEALAVIDEALLQSILDDHGISVGNLSQTRIIYNQGDNGVGTFQLVLDQTTEFLSNAAESVKQLCERLIDFFKNPLLFDKVAWQEARDFIQQMLSEGKISYKRLPWMRYPFEDPVDVQPSLTDPNSPYKWVNETKITVVDAGDVAVLVGNDILNSIGEGDDFSDDEIDAFLTANYQYLGGCRTAALNTLRKIATTLSVYNNFTESLRSNFGNQDIPPYPTSVYELVIERHTSYDTYRYWIQTYVLDPVNGYKPQRVAIYEEDALQLLGLATGD